MDKRRIKVIIFSLVPLLTIGSPIADPMTLRDLLRPLTRLLPTPRPVTNQFQPVRVRNPTFSQPSFSFASNSFQPVQNLQQNFRQPPPSPPPQLQQLIRQPGNAQSEQFGFGQVELIGAFDNHPKFPDLPNFFSNLESAPVYEPQYSTSPSTEDEEPVVKEVEEITEEVEEIAEEVEEDTKEISEIDSLKEVVDIRASEGPVIDLRESEPATEGTTGLEKLIKQQIIVTDEKVMSKLIEMAKERLKTLEELNEETEAELIPLTPVKVGEKVASDGQQNMDIVMVEFPE